MQLGEVIATYDVGLALKGESGKFEVTSPTGETYVVTCKPDHSISNWEWYGNKTSPQPFLLRKIAEQVSVEQKNEMSARGPEDTAQMLRTRVPFLLENQVDSPVTPYSGDRNADLNNPQANLKSPETATLELFYQEAEPITNRSLARLYIRAEQHGQAVEVQRWITSPCASFNELDAEIRRLQAQLDEIRSLAKKKFYKAQAVAVGA